MDPNLSQTPHTPPDPLPDRIVRDHNEVRIDGDARVGQVAVGSNNTLTTIGTVIKNVFSSDDAARNRRDQLILLDKVKSFWVAGVLENSMYHSTQLGLGKETRPEAVDHPWDMVVQTPHQFVYTMPPGKAMMEIFDDMDRAVLILGTPGSGKTITLLELARDLIVIAEGNINAAIPVVFNLSSWTPKQRIADWLIDELGNKYQIPKRIGRSWVEKDDLIVLLDGLDEVQAEYQKESVKAINSYRQEHGVAGIVVSSRLAEYEAVQNRLNLGGAILLQPLTPSQIESYLAKNKLAALLTALHQDAPLQELAQTPLMLNMMCVAYESEIESILETEAVNSMEERRAQLFDLYIANMLKRKGINPYFPLEQTLRQLTWLAQEMRKHARSIFLIEQIQPSWLSTRGQLWAYVLGSRLISSLILGLSVGLSLWLNPEDPELRFWQGIGFSNSLSVGITIGVCVGLVVGLIDLARFDQSSKMARDRNHSMRWWTGINILIYAVPAGLIAGMIGGQIGGLLTGLGVGLTSALTFGLIFGFRSTGKSAASDIQTSEALSWSWSHAAKGFAFGAMGGLIYILLGGLIRGAIDRLSLLKLLFYGLGGGLIGATIGGLKRRVLDMKTVPNQGIRLSIRNVTFSALITGLVGGLVGGLISGLSRVPEFWVSGALTGAIIAGVWFGGMDIIQHYTLRFVLYASNQFPWNISRFLDYATDLIFLQQVGGGFIFIHRLLLEHFAAMGESQRITQYDIARDQTTAI